MTLLLKLAKLLLLPVLVHLHIRWKTLSPTVAQGYVYGVPDLIGNAISALERHRRL